MKLFAILLVCTISMAYSATLDVNPQCSVCNSVVDWVRANDNVLSFMKTNERVSEEFIELIESDVASKDVCGLLSMCDTDDNDMDFLTNLRGGRGGGGRGGGGRGGRKKKRPRHGPGSLECEQYHKC